MLSYNFDFSSRAVWDFFANAVTYIISIYVFTYYILRIVYGKTFEGGNFRGFLAFRESFTPMFLCQWWLLWDTGKHEAFPANGGFILQLRNFFPLESSVCSYTYSFIYCHAYTKYLYTHNCIRLLQY